MPEDKHEVTLAILFEKLERIHEDTKEVKEIAKANATDIMLLKVENVRQEERLLTLAKRVGTWDVVNSIGVAIAAILAFFGLSS